MSRRAHVQRLSVVAAQIAADLLIIAIACALVRLAILHIHP